MSQQKLLQEALADAEEELSSEITGPAREAKLYSLALTKLFVTQTSLGNAILDGLWHVYKNGLVMYLGDDGTEYNPEDFAQWALDTYSEIVHNKDYLVSLINVVLRVFQPVHAASVRRTPYVTPDTKQRVSVDDLLTEGKVGKLTQIQSAFQGADEKDRGELLGAVLHGTRKETEAVRDKVQGKQSLIILPYYWQTDVRTGLHSIYIDGLTNEQLSVFKGLLGKSGKELLRRKE